MNSSCTMRLSYNEQCNPPLTECTEGLICTSKDRDDIYRCDCPNDDNKVWDSTTQRCLQKETLLSIYVPDKLNIMDAIEFCDEEYSGRLASEDEFKHLFVDCVDFADDFWLVPNTSSEGHFHTDMCLLVYQGVDVRSVNCSQTHSFVCVILGLLWWVLAAALSLIAIGVVCMAIVFRR
ncbi:uncharacterized protein LOC110465505 [Mizuhopecten yessoensis]|uniref:uncharacterized protein LOC110465505 n=1 Tax=Mizuhopecten yessoensis TaxID=6573 RepID=UPI000B45C898|nr:uncharacterized protein LOC110465505 [Mizuhopecten yessoensis]